MKRTRAVAAVLVAGLGVGGLLAAGGAPASASSEVVSLYSQLNDTASYGSVARGTATVTLFVTPTSTGVGQPITILAVGSTLPMVNPLPTSAAANTYEVDAVVRLAGVDYTLRGPQNTVTVASGANIANGGWIVSSAPGLSSATSAGGSAATTGIGSTLRGLESTPFALSAPGTPGTYTFGLKAIILNRIASGGGPGLTDLQDEITNTDPTNAGAGPGTVGPGGPTGSFATNSSPGTTPGQGNILFSTPVTLTVLGPNATITASSGQNAGVQAVRPPEATWFPSTSTMTLTGSVWGASVGIGGFTVQWCDATGASCVAGAATGTGSITNTLTTNASGALSGSITLDRSGCTPAGCFQPMLTTGNRTLRITQGSNVALVPLLVLAPPSVTVSPTAGAAGAPTTVTGSSFNPNQPTTVHGYVGTCFTFCPQSDDPQISGGTATSAGLMGPVSYTVNDRDTNGIHVYQGVEGTPSASNPFGFTAYSPNKDACVAYASNATGGPGCSTKQDVNVSVLQGRLVQRAYVNTTPASGPGVVDGSAIVAPIAGTGLINPDATTVNLGSVTAPLAPAVISGTLNDITVTDNRGGTFGWSLTATMPNFTGVPAAALAANRLAATPACAPATNATAWDYDAVGKTAIAGFDDTLNAPGVTAGAASQNFGGSVLLCSKNTSTNATTQTTGGVYNVTASLALSLPAFQSAAKYTSTITVLLA